MSHIDREVWADVQTAFPETPSEEGDDLMALLLRVVLKTQKPFFFIIDEWDAICREFPPKSKGMDSYVNWLRRMFKSVSANTAFARVYMTGILPPGLSQLRPHEAAVLRAQERGQARPCH